MKVLFITSTRIGDAVLSTGILNHIITQYPNADITIACGPLPQSLFEGFPNVTRILALKKKKRHGHWIDLWKTTYKTKWDLVIDLRNSAVSRLIRARQRFIFGNHIDKTKHKVEQAAQMMQFNQIPAPKLYFTSAQNEFADKFIPRDKMVIGVGPSANWIGKTWPSENFIEIIKWLTDEGGIFSDAHVAVFAAPNEEAQANPVLLSIPDNRRIDIIAKGNPGQVSAALSRCQFYIGNDSGLMHAAAACGVPTVGVFGPSYPHLYAPWGAHTAYARTPETFDELIDFEGYAPEKLTDTLMKSLNVETVKQTIKDFMN